MTRMGRHDTVPRPYVINGLERVITPGRCTAGINDCNVCTLFVMTNVAVTSGVKLGR